jgi:Mlc titration factor MtfA (ptsG expression regulator)
MRSFGRAVGPGVGVAVVTLVAAFAFRGTLSDAQGLLAVLATVALVAGGVVLGQRVVLGMRWTHAVALPSEPVPDGWAELVRARFPLASDLSTEDFERLLKLVQLFLRTKRMEGAGGLEITEEIRVTIAAQACFLILWLHVGLYPVLRTVLVYPSTMVPRYARHPLRGPEPEEEASPILGQSWRQGVVILAWDSARHGAFDPRDGRNVVFHEFAHQLDQETGDADGLPVGLRLSAVKPWAEVIERRFGELARAEQRGQETVMDPYGATNHAEFFAVATEAFFEKPRELRDKKPDLYDLLSDFYGVDPARGLARTRPAPTADERHEGAPR